MQTFRKSFKITFFRSLLFSQIDQTTTKESSTPSMTPFHSSLSTAQSFAECDMSNLLEDLHFKHRKTIRKATPETSPAREPLSKRLRCFRHSKKRASKDMKMLQSQVLDCPLMLPRREEKLKETPPPALDNDTILIFPWRASSTIV